jgi:phage tail sheath protein FI
MSPDWSALHLRRTALFAISGVVQNSRWVVFRGSSADDRADLRRQLEAFLGELQAQGALAGVSPREGWFVREPVLREDGLEIEFGIALRRAREFLHFRVTQQGGETEIREFGWQPHLAAAV